MRINYSPYQRRIASDCLLTDPVQQSSVSIFVQLDIRAWRINKVSSHISFLVCVGDLPVVSKGRLAPFATANGRDWTVKEINPEEIKPPSLRLASSSCWKKKKKKKESGTTNQIKQEKIAGWNLHSSKDEPINLSHAWHHFSRPHLRWEINCLAIHLLDCKEALIIR